MVSRTNAHCFFKTSIHIRASTYTCLHASSRQRFAASRAAPAQPCSCLQPHTSGVGDRIIYLLGTAIIQPSVASPMNLCRSALVVKSIVSIIDNSPCWVVKKSQMTCLDSAPRMPASFVEQHNELLTSKKHNAVEMSWPRADQTSRRVCGALRSVCLIG